MLIINYETLSQCIREAVRAELREHFKTQNEVIRQTWEEAFHLPVHNRYISKAASSAAV